MATIWTDPDPDELLAAIGQAGSHSDSPSANVPAMTRRLLSPRLWMFVQRRLSTPSMVVRVAISTRSVPRLTGLWHPGFRAPPQPRDVILAALLASEPPDGDDSDSEQT
jgi:hypothetical protein